MYRLVSGDKVVGVFEKVRFTKVNKERDRKSVV